MKGGIIIFEPTSMGLSIQSVFKSGPFSTMMPAISWPRVKGQGSGFGQWPFRMCRSVPQTPQAPILMRADFADIFGQATCRMTGSAPGPSKVANSNGAVAHRFS